MRIGINAQLLSFSQNYRNGGVSRYIRALLTELAKQPGEHEYTVFVNGQEVIEQLSANHPQITYVAAPWAQSQPAARIAWEQFTLPSLIRQKKIAVLHSPVNVLPERLPQNCAGVITLHDLAFMRFPDVLTRSKRLYHRAFTVRSMRRATSIIAVSDSTKQDAVELIGIPAERIQTVYPCINERFSNVLPKEEEITALRSRYALENGFLLYLGTLEPRKNIPSLIEAFARLKQTKGIQQKLVIAGSKGWLYDSIFAKVQECGLASEVIFPGFVPDAEQATWYASASVFAYPALYEGFGLPVAEALACGTPTVTSTVSSLPEAGAGLALTVEPRDIPAIADALYTALTDTAFREQCKTMAASVAEHFSARIMVQQTIHVYEQAAASRTRTAHSRNMSFVQ